MKKFVLLALLAVAFIGCNMISPEKPEYRLSDLQGLWQNDQYDTWHVRFTADAADQVNYFWGCEWGDYGDDVTEEDLVFHGDGWFKYRLNEDELLEIHKMDQGWADIPKVYIVTKLTDTDLEYYEKDHKNIKFKFAKVVEK